MLSVIQTQEQPKMTREILEAEKNKILSSYGVTINTNQVILDQILQS
jgi:hypothetical protein